MEDNLLEISGDRIDGGELVGQRPDKVDSKFLCLNFSAQKPMQAIRQKCLDCCCGNASEVRKCVATDCALWPFRLPQIHSERESSFLKKEATAHCSA